MDGVSASHERTFPDNNRRPGLPRPARGPCRNRRMPHPLPSVRRSQQLMGTELPTKPIVGASPHPESRLPGQYDRDAMINCPTRSDAATLSDEQLLEKLRGFGLDADRAELERLCEGALSVEEVAQPLLDRCGVRTGEGQPNPDWIWLCLLELWRRWWPERVCVEFLGDQIQEGYDALERREATAAAAIWLDAWSDVVRLCELTRIDSIQQFDDRFSMYQSLFNWSQDLEDALGNAGREDPEFLRARIAVCEEALRRFPDEDELMVENRRRAAAESYFELGETDKAEALFEQWLAADPRWGWGWIGWADLHFFTNNRPKDYIRADELLRRGFATPDVRGQGGHRRPARAAVPRDRA